MFSDVFLKNRRIRRRAEFRRKKRALGGREGFRRGDAFREVERHLDADETVDETDVGEHLCENGGKLGREAGWRN